MTKPIRFQGSELTLNFSTSARGFVYLTIRAEDGKELHSTELFGDKVDRVVGFVVQTESPLATIRQPGVAIAAAAFRALVGNMQYAAVNF